MDNVSITLGKNIHKKRCELNMTQVELAHLIGVTYQAVSKWERGKGTPDISLLPRLARVFGCSIDDLFSCSA